MLHNVNYYLLQWLSLRAIKMTRDSDNKVVGFGLTYGIKPMSGYDNKEFSYLPLSGCLMWRWAEHQGCKFYQ